MASDAEWVAGRNSVVELLRTRVPVAAVYVAEGAERDGRLREAFKLAAEQGVSLLEVARTELDRLTSGAVHQGLAARIPAYEYAHPDDLLARAEAVLGGIARRHLDLDDVGAPISELLDAGRACAHAREVDHAQVGEGFGARHNSFTEDLEPRRTRWTRRKTKTND